MRPQRVEGGARVQWTVEHSDTMPAGSRLALGCLVFSLCVLLSEAYLFSLLLSNPVVPTDSVGGAGPDRAASDSDLRSGEPVRAASESVGELRTRAAGRSETELDLDLDLELELGLDLGVTSVGPGGEGGAEDQDLNRPAGRRRFSASLVPRHSARLSEDSATEEDSAKLLAEMMASERSSERSCLSDQVCGRGRFCDSETGTCQRRRRPGQPCSRDGQCRGRSSSCTLGHCQRRQHKEKKELVSECRSDTDCDSDSCCARLSSGTVCRPRTPVGQRCQALPANLPVPIYATCPCERGSACKYVHRPGEDWTLWTAYDNLRCVRD
ncbi:uncharacterized protein LOC122382030 [Amphibalanus amphitrite]|uniref:uncharacterized protein LOC122382030 n=1 Tax=Amphibalanus amphitrite TaxID=1232801 RepID=UPI001C907F1F|nr:uncharacterized protein LOC122382030 [Amphibalanus amphitrite]